MRRYVGVLSRLLILSAIAGLLGACASHSNAPAPKSAASPAYNYLIGPGDALSVIVWRNPDLSTSVTVRPDGKITVPLVEDLPAIGKDSTALARDVEKALAKYIRDPVVTIMVTGFIGPYSEQIRVVGANRASFLPTDRLKFAV